MNFKGIIIEESLSDKSILNDIKILKTKVEKVTPEHKTPWLKQWTLHTVEIDNERAKEVAKKLSENLDTAHNNWYADFRNKNFHYIIFKDKIFKIDRSKSEEYKAATTYGISLGIPSYQVDFSPGIKEWER